MGTFGTPDSLFGSPGLFGEGDSSSNYGGFIVQLWNPDNTVVPVAGVDVKFYDGTNLADLGLTVTSLTDGSIPGGSLSLAVGTELRFRVEDDGHGRAGWCYQVTVSDPSPADGMNLLLKPSSGQNILFWPMAVAPYYAAATVAPARFDIYYRELPDINASDYNANDPRGASSALFLGSFGVGQKVEVPFNPQSDKTIRVTQMPFNAFGIPAFRSLEDAEAHGAYMDFDMSRSSGTTTISQYGNSGDTSITLKVSGYGVNDHYRWVRSADDTSVQQVETLTVTVTAVTAGTLVVTVTANGLTGSPRAVNVTLAGSETDAQVATKIKDALAADSVLAAFFTSTTSTADVIATVKDGIANDVTMSLVITASHGVGAATSANTTAGVAGFSTNVVDSFVDLTAGIADPTFFFLTRASDTGVITRYVKIAHSSRGLSGPWGAFSNVLSVTYSHTGSGGGTAPSDPQPPDRQPFGFGA